MARAPAPQVIPGQFFVLTFDFDSRAYTMFVDDATHSSYNLGSDVQEVMRYFRVASVDTDLGNRAIDLAREFGAAQAIPEQGRVFKIAPLTPQRGSLDRDVFAERPDDRVYNLPGLM